MLPPGRIVDTSLAFRGEFMPAKATGITGQDNGFAAPDQAFTTWLDFSQASRQARRP